LEESGEASSLAIHGGSTPLRIIELKRLARDLCPDARGWFAEPHREPNTVACE
jgi:hypothetical protein